jgi:hypothetical protein
MESKHIDVIQTLKEGGHLLLDKGITSGGWDTFTKAYEEIRYKSEKDQFEVCYYYAPQYGADYGHYYYYLSETELIKYLDENS